MIPRVATILSAREWEADLVTFIRESASARLVLRAYQPAELEERHHEIDVVVAGAETSWVTAAAIAAWKRSGLGVVGIYPVADTPARRILETGRADEILVESSTPESKVAAIRAVFSDPIARVPTKSGLLMAVTGARGAPGRTEVALALAWNLAPDLDVVVLDADLEAPSLAIRLGLPARPDSADAADAIRIEGVLDDRVVHSRDGVSFIVGSHRPGEPPLRWTLVEDVVEAALGHFDVVVADLGPAPDGAALLKRSDAAVLVARADAVGIVRASRVAAEWSGPPPALVVNRVNRRSAGESLTAARQWLGLDPLAMIAEDRRIDAAARAADAPSRVLLRQLASVGVGG